MRRLISAPARHDIAGTLDWSRENFGADARRRYERLIARGLAAITVAQDPPGSRRLDAAGVDVRVYHLRNSRRTTGGLLVREPRHFLVYERPEPRLIVVLRLLHDAMDLPERLQDGM